MKREVLRTNHDQPRITSEREGRLLVKLCRDNPRKNAVELNTEIAKNFNVKCSVTITKERLNVRNCLADDQQRNHWCQSRTVTPNKVCKEHLNWTPQQWSKVLWSDESKIFGSDGVRYIRRPPGERFNPKYQLPTVKHDGGNMVWGCF